MVALRWRTARRTAAGTSGRAARRRCLPSAEMIRVSTATTTISTTRMERRSETSSWRALMSARHGPLRRPFLGQPGGTRISDAFPRRVPSASRSCLPQKPVDLALELGDDGPVVRDLRPLGGVRPRLEAGEALPCQPVLLAELAEPPGRRARAGETWRPPPEIAPPPGPARSVRCRPWPLPHPVRDVIRLRPAHGPAKYVTVSNGASSGSRRVASVPSSRASSRRTWQP